MTPRLPIGVLCCVLASLPVAGVLAQDRPAADTMTRTDRLRVFLDCQAPYCDFDFVRTEITFVDYVRDRRDARLHVLVTAQQTGGGGWEFILAFLGLEDLRGQDQTLRYVSRQNDTEDEIRTGLMNTLKIGLVRYVADTPIAARLRVSLTDVDTTEAQDPADDPWNLWSFRISATGRMSGEHSSKSSGVSGSLSASRVTEMWKFTYNGFGSYNQGRSEFVLPDTVLRDAFYQHSFENTALLVRSIGGHWAAGLEMSATGSTRENQRLTVRIAPAIEGNFFPYAESTRRKLVARYTVGMSRYAYHDSTIYFRIDEVLANHSLLLGFVATQPWGSVNFSLNGSQAFRDADIFRLTGGGFGEFRLFRGFSLTMFGSYSRINDQIYLSKSGATAEEVLTRRRQLATSYQYFGSVGLSYRFGSIFQNVVNPRMTGSDFFFCC